MRQEGEITPVGKIISDKKVFDNKYFTLLERVIETPDGLLRDPQYVWDRSDKEFSVALALTPENQFILVSEPKYGQMDNFLVIPTGGIGAGETAEEAARREFNEETGYHANRWIQLPNLKKPDFVDKIDGGDHYFFLGFGAERVGDPEIYREVFLVDKEEAYKLVDDMHKELVMKLAMSTIGLMLGLRYLEKTALENI